MCNRRGRSAPFLPAGTTAPPLWPPAGRRPALLSSPAPMPSTPDPPDSPLVIGWKEYLGLPELGIPRLKTKVDTGARTSALHVESYRVLDQRPDGTAELEMTVAAGSRHHPRPVIARARVLRHARVTDSGGHSEVRPVIETEMVLGPVRKRILVTLTDRSGMLFRMILGRKALEGDFIVDVGRKYLLGGRPTRRRRAAAGAAVGEAV